MPRYIDAEMLMQKIKEDKQLSNWAKGVAITLVMDTPVVDLRNIGLSQGFSSVDELMEVLDRD